MRKKINYCSLLLLFTLSSSIAIAQDDNEECREKRISCVDLAIGISTVDASLDALLLQSSSLT